MDVMEINNRMYQLLCHRAIVERPIGAGLHFDDVSMFVRHLIAPPQWVDTVGAYLPVSIRAYNIVFGIRVSGWSTTREKLTTHSISIKQYEINRYASELDRMHFQSGDR